MTGSDAIKMTSSTKSTTCSALEAIDEDPLLKAFLVDDFDLKGEVSAIVSSYAITDHLLKLNRSLQKLDQQIHEQVSSHYPELLSQATGLEKLESLLVATQGRTKTLLASVERIRNRLVEPYDRLEADMRVLANLQGSCDMLRRVIRVLYLSARLSEQLEAAKSSTLPNSKGTSLATATDVTRAAQTLAELDHLEGESNLSQIKILEKERVRIRDARIEVDRQARLLLQEGMEKQNQTQVATSLQAFFNLGSLQSVVDETLEGIRDKLRKEISSALQVITHSQAPSGTPKAGPGRSTLPGSGTAFRANLWSSMERLMDQLYVSCLKVQHLQKVLTKKRDPLTGACFLDEVIRQSLLHSFWSFVTTYLAKEVEKAAEKSTHMRQAFEGEYPRLLRICGDLWRKLSQFSGDHLGSVSSLESGSEEPGLHAPLPNAQEGVTASCGVQAEKALRTVLEPFERAYLSRSVSRLFDPVNVMFELPKESQMGEIGSVVRAVSTELAVSSDPALSLLVAKNVAKTIRLLLTKCEAQVDHTGGSASQPSSTPASPPGGAAEAGGLGQVIHPPTQAQRESADLANLLCHFHREMKGLLSSNVTYSEEVRDVIEAALKELLGQVKATVTPLIQSVEKYIADILLTLHQEDFSQSRTSVQGSACLKELKGFLGRISREFLSLYSSECRLQVLDRECLFPVARRTVLLFLRHAALLRPLEDKGKTALAADCAALETVVAEYLYPNVAELGRPYKTLRLFRPLLFQSYETLLQSPALGDALPYSFVLHCLFSRGPADLKSVTLLKRWTPEAYSEWLDAHPQESDRLEMVQEALENYSKKSKTKADVYPVMVQLLKRGLQVKNAVAHW